MDKPMLSKRASTYYVSVDNWLLRRFYRTAIDCFTKKEEAIAPTHNNFSIFATDSQRAKELDQCDIVFFTDIKVLLKFYFRNSNLVVRILRENKNGNSTCIGCLYPVVNGSYIRQSRCGAIVLSMQKVDQDLNYG